MGRIGKRRQLIVAVPQDLESRLKLAHSIVMELNFLRHYLKMKLFRIAAFPSANLISPKKWANIGVLSLFESGAQEGSQDVLRELVCGGSLDTVYKIFEYSFQWSLVEVLD